MKSLFLIPADFEVKIYIFAPEDGGRKSPTYNGIRWDFVYSDDMSPDTLYMIPPDFYDENGDSISNNKPLPINKELPARMLILNDELRTSFHRNKIKIGTKFYCCEGAKKVASGTVTKITGLFDERAK